MGGLSLLDSRLGLGPGRIDHPDQAGHLQVGHVLEQVSLGIEGGAIDVPPGGGHHPLAESGHPLDVVLGPAGQVSVPGDGRSRPRVRWSSGPSRPVPHP